MTRLALPLLTLVLFASCSLRIISDGKKVHGTPQPVNDSSILVTWVDSNSRLPPQARLLGNVLLKSGLQHEVFATGFIPYAEWQAQRMGGNVIEIQRRYGLTRTKYLCSRMITKIYSLPPPFLDNYKREQDSLADAFKDSIGNICILHIQNGASFGWQEAWVFFNDSLIGRLKGANVLQKVKQLDITLHKSGTLSLGLSKYANQRQKIAVNVGQVYYISIYTSGAKHPTENIQVLNRDEYDELRGKK